MKKWGLVVAGLVVVSLWSAVAYGQGRWARGQTMTGGPGSILPVLLRGVDLTAEQKTRVQEIMAAHRSTFRTLFSQLRVARGELADKLLAPGPLRAEDLAPQVQRVAQLREQLVQEGLKAALEIRGVLTPEQLAKAAQVKARIQTLRDEIRGLLREQP